MHDPLLILANAPCACAEFTRIHIGSFSFPVGILTVLFALTALLLAPGLALGWVARRREALATARIIGPDGPR